MDGRASLIGPSLWRDLFLAVSLLLASTSANAATGADGFRFSKPEQMRPAMTVSLVLYASRSELTKAAVRAGVKEQGFTVAFAVINRGANTCVLHILNPSTNYYPEFVGHELLHCFFGDFHGRAMVVKYDDFGND